jgi:plasmid replication initiation protein
MIALFLDARDELDRVRVELGALAGLLGAVPDTSTVPDRIFEGLASLLYREVEVLERVEDAERAKVEATPETHEVSPASAPPTDRPWTVESTVGPDLSTAELKALRALADRWAMSQEQAVTNILTNRLAEVAEVLST